MESDHTKVQKFITLDFITSAYGVMANRDTVFIMGEKWRVVGWSKLCSALVIEKVEKE